jgi:hypothetical protein
MNTLLRWIGCAGLLGAALLMSSCVSSPARLYGGTPQRGAASNTPDMRNLIGFNPQDMLARQRFMQDYQANPDLPAWHDQREKMALAIGDRVIDKSFERTFDSMIIALANLGCRVNNMERTSGYITSSLPELPPEQSEQLKKDAMGEYAQAKGYPPSVLDDKTSFNIAVPGAMAEKMTAGVTLTMTRVGPTQTKVKLRFNNVYHPRIVEELYKRVWDSIDKQIFLDKSLG